MIWRRAVVSDARDSVTIVNDIARNFAPHRVGMTAMAAWSKRR